MLAHGGAYGDEFLGQLLDVADRYTNRGALVLGELHEPFGRGVALLQDAGLLLERIDGNVALRLEVGGFRLIALGALVVVPDRDEREQERDAEALTDRIEC